MMTNVEKLESLIAEGWQIPLALFLVLNDLLRKHPQVMVEVWLRDDAYGGVETPILDIFVARKRKRTIEAMYAAFADVPGIYIRVDSDPEAVNLYFEYELERR